MIPDLILNVNGTDLTIPGTAWLTAAIVVGSILYMVLGCLLVGRPYFAKKVAEDSHPRRVDVTEYTITSLILSVLWPITGGLKFIGKITKPLLMSKASKEKLDRFL